MIEIAVLLTCYNRKQKTLSCLKALHECILPSDSSLSVFLVDDGSDDETGNAVIEHFPTVSVITSHGSLYWAGGMRLAWQTAINSDKTFHYYLLLNDDTVLLKDAFVNLFSDLSLIENDIVILVGSTFSAETNKITYGGRKLAKSNNPASSFVMPNETSPQNCDLGNANVMLVSASVVKKIGVLSDKFTHGIADYDYTMRANSVGASVFVTSKYLGFCENEHGNNWLPAKSTLKQRLDYLYSVKGLSYNEYLFYIKSHFPSYVFIAKTKLWLKTFFPFIWDKLK